MKFNIIIAFLIIILSYLSLHTHWSDSELWAISLSRTFFDFQNPSNYYKPLFYLFTFLPTLLFKSSVLAIDSIRLLFSVVALTQVIILYKIMQFLSPQKNNLSKLVLIFVSLPIFLNQSYQVRSDILASLLVSFVFLLVLQWSQKNQNSKSLGLKIITIAFILIAAILCTPKAIFHILVALAFLGSAELKISLPWRKILLPTMIASLGLLVFFIIYRNAFSTAWDFFITSYSGSAHHPSAWSFSAFRYLLQFLINQPHLIILFILLVYQQPRFLLSYLVLLLSLVFYSDRLPFFIYSLLPIPFCFLVYLKKDRLLYFISFFGVILGLVHILFFTTKNDNSLQKESLSKIESYLEQHQNPTYFDAAGIINSKNKIFALPAPEHEGNEHDILNQINRSDLKLVFWGNRLFYYYQSVLENLEKNYFIHIGSGVYAKSKVYDLNKSDDRIWLVNFCSRNDGSHFFYKGSHFLKMNFMSKNEFCDKKFLAQNNLVDFIAISDFEPISLEKDFAQIFDHQETGSLFFSIMGL